MSDNRPPLFADGDITPPRGTPATVGAGDTRRIDASWDDHDEYDEWDEPNYLVRRALIVAAVVAVIALVAIVVSRFIGGGSDDGSSSDADWNTIVVVTEDAIILYDDDGEEVDEFDAELLDDQLEVVGDTLISVDDTGRITLTDLTDGSRRTDRIDDNSVLRVIGGHASIAVADLINGGDVAVIDTERGNVISIADVADLDDPLIFGTDVLVNAEGTHAAAPVPRLFQSYLIDLETETSTALAGRVIALGDDLVVTEQPAGDESEIEFYDLAGDRLGSVDVPAPQGRVLLSDGSLMVISADGQISRVTPDGADDIGELIDPDDVDVDVRGAALAMNGERIVVITGERLFVLDAEGDQIGSVTGSLRSFINPTAGCISIINDGANDIVELDTATVLASVDRGVVGASSVDGCTAAIFGTEPVILRDGELIDVDADSVQAIAPDGSKYVVSDRRDIDLANFDDGDTVELTDDFAVIRFAER